MKHLTSTLIKLFILFIPTISFILYIGFLIRTGHGDERVSLFTMILGIFAFSFTALSTSYILSRGEKEAYYD